MKNIREENAIHVRGEPLNASYKDRAYVYLTHILGKPVAYQETIVEKFNADFLLSLNAETDADIILRVVVTSVIHSKIQNTGNATSIIRTAMSSLR